MNHVRATRSLWTRSLPKRRIGQVSIRGLSIEPQQPPRPSSSQPAPPSSSSTTPPISNPNPSTPLKPASRVGTYYKSFSYPILKAFLIALLTYQLTYYAWLKLETIEEKNTKSTEIRDLQEELRQAILAQKQRAGDALDELGDKVDEYKAKLDDYTEEAKEAGRAVAESVREGTEEVGKGTRAVGKVAGGGWWPW